MVTSTYANKMHEIDLEDALERKPTEYAQKQLNNIKSFYFR